MDFLTTQTFAYEMEGDSAVILRCFSRDSHIKIPSQIAGMPVVGLAPYAFSAHMDEKPLFDALRDGRARVAAPDEETAVSKTGSWEQYAANTSAAPAEETAASKTGSGEQYAANTSAAFDDETTVPETGSGGQDGLRPLDADMGEIGSVERNALRPSAAGTGKNGLEGQDGSCLPPACAKENIAGCPAMCGEALRELILPPTLRHIGRYCFYNCSGLRRLEFSGDLHDWGSGCFTGCHQVKELCVRADPDGETGLKQVLDELPESLKVEFCVPFREQTHKKILTEKWKNEKWENTPETEAVSADEKKSRRRILARLVFPEFYEEGVENTPARILETHVHGTGIRYRNCFPKSRLDFSQYDSIFPYARAQENEELLLELVLGRLRWPYRLGPEAQSVYEQYVRENLLLFGEYFINEKDSEGLAWFLERFAGTRDTLPEELSEYAWRKGDVGAVSLLMNFENAHRPAAPRRRRLEL
ncbi:MAG: leucine-rich repeat domain-containing protein [Lachnospiraceae bacterium]|nr:leucine-rich repeat domain-containing protein [Lachnospiraceae bacterium]